MPKGDEYTLEDFKRDILKALNAQLGGNKVGLQRPPTLEGLLAQSKLAAGKTKR